MLYSTKSNNRCRIPKIKDKRLIYSWQLAVGSWQLANIKMTRHKKTRRFIIYHRYYKNSLPHATMLHAFFFADCKLKTANLFLSFVFAINSCFYTRTPWRIRTSDQRLRSTLVWGAKYNNNNDQMQTEKSERYFFANPCFPAMCTDVHISVCHLFATWDGGKFFFSDLGCFIRIILRVCTNPSASRRYR